VFCTVKRIRKFYVYGLLVVKCDVRVLVPLLCVVCPAVLWASACVLGQ
jgi:hypothetical protein